MSLARLITEIWWEPGQGFDARAATTFSDPTKVRLDPADWRLKLALQTTFRYPLDADLAVRSRTYRPEAVQRLLMLQVNASIPRDEDGNPLASVGLRLYDGTNERWWDGGTWAVAGAGNWNTEDEVNAHIQDFDVTARQFAVVLNLVTTDELVTPAVESVFVLWEGRVDWYDDLLLDSLTRTVQDEAIYTADFALPPLDVAGAAIDLNDYQDESPLDVVDVEAVFDHVADPYHRTDLLVSYNPGTRVVTLSASIPAGGVPFLRLRTRATVAWDTQQDFTEVGHLPEVILRDAETVSSSPYPRRSDQGIVRKSDGAAVKVPAPYRTTFQITMEVRTDRSREQHRLLETLMKLLVVGPTGEEGPFLRSRATDRRYRIWLLDEFRAQGVVDNLSDVRTFQTEFRVVDAAMNLRPAVDAFAVKRLNLGFAAIDSEEEQRALVNGAPIPHTEVETLEVT